MITDVGIIENKNEIIKIESNDANNLSQTENATIVEIKVVLYPYTTTNFII